MVDPKLYSPSQYTHIINEYKQYKSNIKEINQHLDDTLEQLHLNLLFLESFNNIDLYYKNPHTKQLINENFNNLIKDILEDINKYKQDFKFLLQIKEDVLLHLNNLTEEIIYLKTYKISDLLI